MFAGWWTGSSRDLEASEWMASATAPLVAANKPPWEVQVAPEAFSLPSREQSQLGTNRESKTQHVVCSFRPLATTSHTNHASCSSQGPFWGGAGVGIGLWKTETSRQNQITYTADFSRWRRRSYQIRIRFGFPLLPRAQMKPEFTLEK